MRTPVNTGLPASSVPAEHAVVSNGYFYSAHIPLKNDGTIETGSMEVQTKLVFANLEQSLKAAGGMLDDVNQVLLYISDPADFAEMNKVYATVFNKPYPQRATVVVGLLEPGMKIEIVVHAHIPSKV